MKLTLAEAIEHVPREMPQHLDRDVRADMFPEYIFATRQGKKQFGYCTHCQQDFEAEEKMSHNGKAFCPSCLAHCTVKASGLGRKSLIDQVYYTYYMKSELNPNAIVAIGYRAVRDHHGDYRKVETVYRPQTIYVFTPGQGGVGFYSRAYYESKAYGECDAGSFTADVFQRMGTVKCQFNRDGIGFVPSGYSRKSIAEAVAGTPFEHSTWEQYEHGDMTEFFDLFARYPTVEYLTKLGFARLVNEKLSGYRTHSAVNWRGKTLQKVLRLKGSDLQVARKNPKAITFDALYILQQGAKDGSNFRLQEVIEIASKLEMHNLKDAKGFQEQYGNIRKLFNYVERQFELAEAKDKKEKRYYNYASALSTWRDYIRDCKQLGYDLTNRKIVFPKDLDQAHKETIRQVKIQANPEIDAKIRARVRKLKNLTLRVDNLIIRSVKDMGELIDEGQELKHCVGTYANGHAEGKCIIMVIRRLTEPDKPYYTLEVNRGRIAQCYGFRHAKPTPEVERLIDLFEQQKLGIKKELKEVAV